MVGTLSSHARVSTIHLFGPQALAFRDETFLTLKHELKTSPHNQWILRVLETLPELWESASKELSTLQSFPGGQFLESLNTWLKDRTTAEAILPFPNTLLTPIVVITHLTQYLKYLEHIDPTYPEPFQLQSPLHTNSETLGFCTGLLSAIAVSRSTEKEQFQRNGATAIRLAMLIGALVDAEDVSNPDGGAVSQSITWSTLESQVKLLEILKRFPQAYISVLYDEKRATITCSKCVVAKLNSQLRAEGLTVAELNLRGSFHFEGHESAVESLIRFCNTNTALRFSGDAASCPLGPCYKTGSDNMGLHAMVLKSILVEQCDWYRTFAAAHSSQPSDSHFQTVIFGYDNCIPPSLARKLGRKLLVATNLETIVPPISKTPTDLQLLSTSSCNSGDIAVVGMACKVAGAEDVGQFWDLLRSGQSQHTEPPADRFHFGTFWRDVDPKRKWYGNFITDPDAFDHKFFKKSPREMGSTDPQQRWMLQIAYQALQQSGYFLSPNQDKHIGCYIGLGCVDYEHNIACYPANAFSATGNLRSFVAGKVSHYFGWTGPSLTIDSACSSSAVAIHHACKAILSDECSAAIAGGVTILTSPQWFQNLAGASFLSPTGNCKPFDINADGYCRGEGVGAVVLKKLSSALADGDQILGVISSSAVYQNQNCTPITVPNADSLSHLFRDVTRKARLEPKHITVVEAHGTGTAVGDPAEYESILRVFGGPNRPGQGSLSLGSVKGLVGHAETAAGIVSLIKILLMIHEGCIPPQASFKTINPAIKHSPSDKIEITTTLKKWDADFRAALINNYGASGSNASLIVTQLPKVGPAMTSLPSALTSDLKFPVCLSGNDENSLRRCSARLREFLRFNRSLGKTATAQDLSFNLYRQSNSTLNRALIFGFESADILEETLVKFENGDPEIQAIDRPAVRPVILCFGGQTSTFVGLDRDIYESSAVFRKHLDQCNLVIRSLGLNDIYPDVFQKETIHDIIKLQTSLFAVQYSCAMTWIDCGINPVSLIGHSFGELTALCVAGILTITGAVKMIANRARIVRDLWGPDKGFMMAIEGDKQIVEQLLRESNEQQGCCGSISIACYNGPRSFTIAGPAECFKTVESIMAKTSAFSSLRSKKLNVTNAYHSVLVEPLMNSLDQVGQELHFREPIIPVERCTEPTIRSNQLSPEFVTQHMRYPVYFSDAVHRLSIQNPASIWLEAGINSTIAGMAGRALNFPQDCHFQAINVATGKGLQSLADATLNLWKQGLNTTFWPYHSSQTLGYNPILLPPYQFDKTRHWVALKRPEEALDKFTSKNPVSEEPSAGLWTFSSYKNSDNRCARFKINTASKEFEDYVSGHTIAHAAPLCPSTLQLDIVIEALLMLRPKFLSSGLQPQLQGLENHAPICLDPTLCVWLDVEATDTECHIWVFNMISDSTKGVQTSTLHVSGTIVFRSNEDQQLHKDFARFESLSGHERCLRLLNGDNGDDVIQGRNIYKVFAEIVDYGQIYRGVQKLVGKENESAGRVVKKYTHDTWLDTPLADSFCQCAGIFVNCMTDISDKEMYISTKIEQWIRSPKLCPQEPRPDVWHVLAIHRQPSEKEYLSDVFIFDSRNGALLEIILGIGYKRVSKRSLGKMLANLTPGKHNAEIASTSLATSSESVKTVNQNPQPTATIISSEVRVNSKVAKDVSEDVRHLLANVSGLEPHEIKDDTGLSDIGIDSLMGMELAREIESVFKCSLDTEVLNGVTDFKSLMKCIQEALGCSIPEISTVISDTKTDIIDIKVDINMDLKAAQTNGDIPHMNGSLTEHENLSLPAESILTAFGESKQLTDKFIADYKFANYADHVLPKQTELCIAYIVEAFEELGVSLRNVRKGEKVDHLQHLPKHEKFVRYLLMMLEKEARLIDIHDDGLIVRTDIQAPLKSSVVLLQELLATAPDHANDHKLTHLIGSKLAGCLSGKCDGVQLIFGSTEGRELVSGLYGKSPINMVWLKQMEDIINRLILKLPSSHAPLRILEMGAGTGGTTAVLAPLLASLGVAVEYTFSDISPSLVAAARKRFKGHSFMRFRVHDIEKDPAEELFHSQHLVIANNCVHATHDLVKSTRQIHKVLRPDGFLMILEMTDTLYWVDVVFGVLEGWWLYDDGRKHVVAHQSIWEKSMLSAGYGHVDWTEGNRPEANIQRIIIALASGLRYDRLPIPLKQRQIRETDHAVRQKVVDDYVWKYSNTFTLPARTTEASRQLCAAGGHSVLVTGATGSLGSHLVAHFARLPAVREVICLNRRNSTDVSLRQLQSFEARGISLDKESLSKLRLFASQSDKTKLGLTNTEYEYLTNSVTHIVHAAWPMSISRPVQGFDSQFRALRNLIDLAVEIAEARPQLKVGFQFISSIATVGYYPIETQKLHAPEERVTVKSVLPNGYGDAKLVCENILGQTLEKYLDRFRPMSVRIGQIAGSKSSGFWNPVEHFSFLVKSSQTLRSFPDLEGELSWYPVDDVAATLADLLTSDNKTYPIYHIENPVRQPWKEMSRLLADLLNIKRTDIIPFDAWMRRVRHFPGSTESNNPAKPLLGFFEDHFARMSCGGLILDTTRCREHSETLANAKPISNAVVAKYIASWKASGFLY